MIVSHDIFTITVLLAVIIWQCCKGKGKKSTSSSYKERTDAEKWADEVKRREMLIQQMKDSGKDVSKSGGYIAWLYNHRPDNDKD